jgi:glycosyltransferase XagB
MPSSPSSVETRTASDAQAVASPAVPTTAAGVPAGDLVSLSAAVQAGDVRLRLGELLIQRKLITPEQLDEALELQRKWGSRLGDVILTMGWLRPLEFYPALAAHFDLDFVDLLKQPADGALLDPSQLMEYSNALYLPWRLEGDTLWVATADPSAPGIQELQRTRPGVRLIGTSKFDIIWELQRVAGEKFSDRAVHYLAEFDPERSASIVITQAQKTFVLGLLAGLFAAAALFPFAVVIGLNTLINVFLFGSFLFRLTLCWMSCAEEVEFFVPDEHVRGLTDTTLPIYTVLVPMYKEPDVLPILTAALRRMDYPRSKLDIKLILEAGDTETIEAAKALALDATFEIVRVPHSLPQTKPKACNYALNLARGKYLTIYDAEDKPEPDQLKKAVLAFQMLGDRAACMQARLNYFNAEENWLTRMFTLEYSLWFDMFLPALDRLGVPIPLGGTSNHFDLAKLREVGAWDPYNVTEDADLGLRFAALGYRVGVINSVTYEEANSQVGNWIRQRSRWIKRLHPNLAGEYARPARPDPAGGIQGFLLFAAVRGRRRLLGPRVSFRDHSFSLLDLHADRRAESLFPPYASDREPREPDRGQQLSYLSIDAGGGEALSLFAVAPRPDGAGLLAADGDRRIQRSLAVDQTALLLGKDHAWN